MTAENQSFIAAKSAKAFYRRRKHPPVLSGSISNSLHIFEQNLLPTTIIEFSGPAVGMAGDALSGLESPVVLEEIGDAGRPERVRRIVSRQPRLFEPAFEHVRGIGAPQHPSSAGAFEWAIVPQDRLSTPFS